MTKIVNHALPKAMAEHLQEILDWPNDYPDAGPSEVIHEFTIKIDEDHEVDLKLCNGDTPWLDVVLFERSADGSGFVEKEVFEPGNALLGEFQFPSIDAKIVIVADPKLPFDGKLAHPAAASMSV